MDGIGELLDSRPGRFSLRRVSETVTLRAGHAPFPEVPAGQQRFDSQFDRIGVPGCNPFDPESRPEILVLEHEYITRLKTGRHSDQSSAAYADIVRFTNDVEILAPMVFAIDPDAKAESNTGFTAHAETHLTV